MEQIFQKLMDPDFRFKVLVIIAGAIIAIAILLVLLGEENPSKLLIALSWIGTIITALVMILPFTKRKDK